MPALELKYGYIHDLGSLTVHKVKQRNTGAYKNLTEFGCGRRVHTSRVVFQLREPNESRICQRCRKWNAGTGHGHGNGTEPGNGNGGTP